jgi:peptidoglycan/LPS O-acetylase OafA/YrhL
VRRHALAVFALASALAAAGIVGAMAVGEHWTDPGLIAWVLAVEFTSHLAFCLIANAVAGFVARPERPWPRRAGEASVVAGCVAIQLAVAFRDALWPGPVTSVADAAVLTLGAGAATTAVAGALLMTKGRAWQR